MRRFFCFIFSIVFVFSFTLVTFADTVTNYVPVVRLSYSNVELDYLGSTAVLFADVSGITDFDANNISYQWFISGDGQQFSSVPDATDPYYIPMTNQQGTLYVKCFVSYNVPDQQSNAIYTAMSDVAIISVSDLGMRLTSLGGVNPSALGTGSQSAALTSDLSGTGISGLGDWIKGHNPFSDVDFTVLLDWLPSDIYYVALSLLALFSIMAVLGIVKRLFFN